MTIDRNLRPDHPLFTRPDWALVDALTCDEAYGKPPGRQPTAILRHLRSLGWQLTRIPDTSVVGSATPTRDHE
jgi:hypothetical protein